MTIPQIVLDLIGLLRGTLEQRGIAVYSNLRLIATHLVGAGLGRHMLWIVPLLAVISLVMLLLPVWRRREQAAWAGQLRWPTLTLLPAAAFRVILLTTLVVGLGAVLMAQGNRFSEKHGRVTERNLGAIRSKWGVAHEQRDLSLAHYVMRKVVQEKFSDGTEEELALGDRQPATGDEPEIIISEETFQPPANETPAKRTLTRRLTKWVRKQLVTESITRSDVTIDVRANPRVLGGAVYAGFDDRWQLVYAVTSDLDFATLAEFRFPLPADGYGVFDRLSVRMDGQEWLSKVRYRAGILTWSMVVQPGQTHNVEISYSSRGLEYLRYQPGDMRERCLVTMNVKGIPPRHLNYPIGSMSPRERVSELSGDEYSLHWDLSRAITNYDIGLIIPAQDQPGYHIAMVLAAAPLGMALLALTLLVTRWLLSGRLDLVSVALALSAFYIGHVLLANLNDVVTSFPKAFGLSIIPLAAAMAVYWKRVDGAYLLPLQSTVIFALFTVFYPLASLNKDAGGTMTGIMYAVLFMYVIGLMAWKTTGRKAESC